MPEIFVLYYNVNGAVRSPAQHVAGPEASRAITDEQRRPATAPGSRLADIALRLSR